MSKNDENMVKVEDLRLSEQNVRKVKDYDKAGLDELAQSMRNHGPQVPLIVRISEDGKKGFEVIAGGRRLEAAKIAGIQELPVVIITADNIKAREISLVENIQRENMDALQEAKVIKDMMTKGKQAEVVGEILGKSRAYVYRRVKLLELPPEAKEMLKSGRLTLGAAAMIAAVTDPKVQKRIMEQEVGEQTLDESVAERVLANCSDLAKAPWDKAENGLGSKIACDVCPERTKNQADLFGTGEGDTCLNSACFRAKMIDFNQRTIAALVKEKKARGATKEEIKKHLVYENMSHFSLSGGLVDLNAKISYDDERKWKNALPKDHGLEVVAIPTQHHGVILAVSEASASRKLPRTRKRKSKQDAALQAMEAKNKKQKQENDLLRKAGTELAQRITHEAVGALKGRKDLWRLLLPVVIGHYAYNEAEADFLSGAEVPNSGHALEAFLKKVEEEEAKRICLGVLLADHMDSGWQGKLDKGIKGILKAAKIDHAKLLPKWKDAIKRAGKLWDELTPERKEVMAHGVKAGACRQCGCTEGDACMIDAGEPCAWADKTRTICTACSEHRPQVKAPKLTAKGKAVAKKALKGGKRGKK